MMLRRKQLNIKQRFVLIVATILFLVSELFPPWRYEYSYLTFTNTCPAPHRFITRPPAVPNYSELQKLCTTSDPMENIKTRKDMGRLNWQRTTLVFLAFGMFLAFNDRKSIAVKVVAAIVLAIGLFLLAGYMLLLYFTYA